MAWVSGDQVGGYLLEHELGRGGQGVVFLATQIRLRRSVALKLIHPNIGGPSFTARFEREIVSLARLDHPNIVTVFDAGDVDGTTFLSMRYVEGESLADYLVRDDPTSTAQAIRVLRQIAAALDHAHGLGVIHRDVKPSNVLISTSGVVFLVDFGIAKTTETVTLTGTGLWLGTPEYMAPEQIEGHEITSRVDIYALGVLAFELLTGCRPYRQSDRTALMWAIMSAPTPLASTARAELGTSFDKALARAMAKSPNDRFESATAFVDALEVADGPPSDWTRVPPPFAPATVLIPPSHRRPDDTDDTEIDGGGDTDRGHRRRQPWMLVGVVGVLLAALVGLAYAAINRDRSADDSTTVSSDAVTSLGSVEVSETSDGEGESRGVGDLEGFKGTTPLVELSEQFTTKLLAIDPSLTEFRYGAETFDAVTLIALAVVQAKTDGIEYANQISGLTRDGTKCTSFAECVALIAAGTDVDYDGVSGPGTFSGNGEPTEASYGVLSFGADNRIDGSETTYVRGTTFASADVAQAAEGTRAGDGILTIGTILPQTGSLDYFGPPAFAGFELAIQEINSAGGVLGSAVVGIRGDSGDESTDIASKTVDDLLAQNVDAIIGATSSNVSLLVIDKITAAGVVQFSPANTAMELSTYSDKGLYFRTAPSDILQAAALASVIADDGNATVAIIARNDAYGTGLADELSSNLAAAGLEVVVTKFYDGTAGAATSDIDALKSAKPSAIVVIGYQESSTILASMVDKDIGPKDINVYGVEFNTVDLLGENFDAGQ